MDSAENAGCVDDTGCRKQPKGDQNKFHDLPPSRLHYSFGLSGHNPRSEVGLSREALTLAMLIFCNTPEESRLNRDAAQLCPMLHCY
jgi:hypothetical protein